MDDFTAHELEKIEEEYILDLSINGLSDNNTFEEILESDCTLSTKSIKALKTLVSNIPNGEVRPQQILLIHSISNTVASRDNGLLQAGTGVGKSIAYLIPAIVSKRKCFISTSTKQLTSQLVEKDLPLLKKYLFKNLKFMGLQSLSNYICPRKMSELLAEHDEDATLFEKARNDDFKSLKIIVPKYEEYIGGNINTDEFTIENLGCNCESFQCAGSSCVASCKFEGKPNCPVYNIVSKIPSCDIVVTNHAFISHMLVRASREEKKKLGILSNRYLWICDEAHDLEHYLEDAFSAELSIYNLKQQTNKLQKYVNEEIIVNTFNNDIVKEESKYKKAMDSDNSFVGVEPYINGFEIREDIIKLGQSIGSIIGILERQRSYAMEKLERDNFNSTYLEEEFMFGHDTVEILASCMTTMMDLMPRFETLDCLNIKYFPTIKRILKEVLEALRIFYLASMDTEAYFTYLTYSKIRDDEVFKIYAVYLRVGDALQSGLGYLDLDKSDLTIVNENKINMIGVSATLCIDGGFKDMADKLGMTKLKGISCYCNDVGTVFDYEKQGLMYIPQDIPDIKAHPKEHGDYFRASVKRLIELSGGGALILCTSKDSTSKTYKYLDYELGSKYNILSADDKKWKNKNDLVKAFRDDKNSVLVGTRGFFQGLDVQGDSLRLLCLDRVPFAPPSVLSRKKEQLVEAKGGNGYRTVAIVPATMILLQAIGRLIRHTSDRGVIALFDNRLYTGVKWISPVVRSIPPFSTTKNIEDVDEFFKNMNE